MEEPANINGAFPRLDEPHRERLRALGTVRDVEPGDVLFHEGDAGYDFFVVESGAVAIVQGYGTQNRVISVHGAHRFLGELNLLTGSRALLSAVVRDGGSVIQVPVAKLRTLTADRGRSRRQGGRLALLARHPPSARVPPAQPHPLPVG